jgi:L-seryl-tRNA(Ser) seleniumtransferase
VNVFERFGVHPIVNAKGTATRLSGGTMHPQAADAMREASQACVDMAELQAAASREISKATGAEAGYVASGASACLLLAAAACIARLDPGRMARLPDTRGMRNEVIMVRSQRNFYDHAIRAAGARIIEAGLPDRYAGAGVRDAEIWQLEDAITPQTAAFHYVADSQSQPPLKDVVKLARKHALPVIVDAAAQLPPQSNLRRFISEGADLVAFSGGKAIGGPQASGILCGRKDLIMSAALQHLDLDIYEDMWEPPKSLIDRRKLKGVPEHGIGRSCKAGKEEIIGLLSALRLFAAEGDAARHKRWLAILQDVSDELKRVKNASVDIQGNDDALAPPLLIVHCRGRPGAADKIIKRLIAGSPSIHTDPAWRDQNKIIVNPMCVAPEQARLIGRKLRESLA